jgi:protein-disulfide isomerase
VQKGLLTAIIAIAALGVILALSPQSRAEEPMTRAQANEIIIELRQMRVLLERLGSSWPAGAAPRGVAKAASAGPAKVGAGTAPVLGSSDAALMIVEFTDYQCPFCQQFHTSVFPHVKHDYIDSGEVRFASRDLPLVMHPNAMSAAHAARCAGEQGKFWEMRHELISNAQRLGEDRYVLLANEIKLDPARFQKCLADQKYKLQIEQDISEAQAVGITGTPTFVIGRSTGDGVEGVLLVGALPYTAFDAKLKELLGVQ